MRREEGIRRNHSFSVKTFVGEQRAKIHGAQFKEGKRSYADMVANRRCSESGNSGGTLPFSLTYSSCPKVLIRLKKAFVGVVLESSMTYNVQNCFKIEGYLAIKVTPL